MSVNNNINSIGNKGGAGGKDGPQFDDFWNLYDKKTSKNGARQYSVKQWYNLSPEERQAAMDFLPQYVAATPVKQYRMSPSSYLTYKAWRVVVIRDGVVVQGINAKGECVPADNKTPLNTPDEQNEVQKVGFKREKKSEVNNLSPVAQKPVSEPQNARKRPSAVSDNPPTLEEIQAYMDERAQQGKPFVYVTAESFLDACEQSGWRLKDGKPMMDWRARMRTFENYRKEHGDRPVAQGRVQVQPKPGDPVGATPTAKGKYKNKW
jgi:hypothetical protein